MKTYIDIEEFSDIDELIDTAEVMYGPGTFVIVGRIGKRNIAAFGQDPAEQGEQVVWPGKANRGQAPAYPART